MRKKIAAANWKMNLTIDEGISLIKHLLSLTEASDDFNGNDKYEFIIAPSFLHISSLQQILDSSIFKVAAQNVSDKEKGAFTGEVSAAMLQSASVNYCIVGHSERRNCYHETNEQIKNKLDLLFAHGVNPIFCCGEPLEIRKEHNEKDFVLRQLIESVFHLDEKLVSKLIIAYEPIWAIGTGQNATPEQAEDIHSFIRSKIAQQYNEAVANEIPIIYGGSVNPANARSLFEQKNIDGALVGGASLVAQDFYSIMKELIHC